MEAAKLAASERFASEPLPSVGLPAWRQMYEHAKAYAASIGLGEEQIPQERESPCLLCQEPLSAASADRICAFRRSRPAFPM
jgi:hypothetical protein